MAIGVEQDPVGAAERIGPVLREHAPAAEAGRRLAAPALDALRRAGLLRMLLPRSLGGLETDPVTFARVMEVVARHDPAAAWALQANMGGWWGARLPDEGVEEVYGADPDVIQAAAFHPPVEAVPAEGGYRLTGRRPLASTIRDAGWLFVTALAGETPIGAVVRADRAEVVETWDSLGMRGTDSNDVVLEDVHVPARRTFVLTPVAEPGSHFRGPLYRIPAMAVTTAVLGPIALGIAREAIEALRVLAQGKRSLGSLRTLRERPVAQAAVGRAEGLVRAARALLYETLSASWERALAGRTATMEQRAGDLLAGVHAVSSAVQAVDLAYGAAGSSAIYERSAIERCFRDVQTIRHHGFGCEGRLETVGQVLLGVEPEFVLLAF